MTTHLSDLQLDALRLGQAEPDTQAHLHSCPQCQQRQALLTSEAAAFAERFDPTALAINTLAKAEVSPAPWWRRVAWPKVSLAAAGLALVLFTVAPQDAIRTKGAATPVEVYVRTPTGPAIMSGPVAPDARLGVRVNPPGKRFTRLLWESGPDQWDALYPSAEQAAWSVRGATWLEREVVLDGARAPERLGAVFCKDSIGHEDAVRALKGRTRPDCSVQRILVEKR